MPPPVYTNYEVEEVETVDSDKPQVPDIDCARTDSGRYIRRHFNPMVAAEAAKLMKYNEQAGYQRLREPFLISPRKWGVKVLEDTCALRIGSTKCFPDICPHPQGSCPKYNWGIWFGPNSRYNKQGQLAKGYPRYQISAVLQALGQAFQILNEGLAERGAKVVKISTNSKHLVQVLAWRTPCWKVWKREVAAEMQGFFDEVDRFWDHLERTHGMTIQLYLVGDETIENAQALSQVGTDADRRA